MTTVASSTQGWGSIHSHSQKSIQLDEKLLRAIGLGVLNRNTRSDLIVAFNSELELRVGNAILVCLTPSEVAKFSALVEAADIDAVGRWFSAHGIDRIKIVLDQFDVLVNELRDNADRITSATSPTRERHHDQ